MECAFREGKRVAGRSCDQERTEQAATRREGRSFLIEAAARAKDHGSKPKAGGVVRSRGECPLAWKAERSPKERRKAKPADSSRDASMEI